MYGQSRLSSCACCGSTTTTIFPQPQKYVHNHNNFDTIKITFIRVTNSNRAVPRQATPRSAPYIWTSAFRPCCTYRRSASSACCQRPGEVLKWANCGEYFFCETSPICVRSLAGLAVQIMHVLINSCDSCTSNRVVLHL